MPALFLKSPFLQWHKTTFKSPTLQQQLSMSVFCFLVYGHFPRSRGSPVKNTFKFPVLTWLILFFLFTNVFLVTVSLPLLATLLTRFRNLQSSPLQVRNRLIEQTIFLRIPKIPPKSGIQNCISKIPEDYSEFDY